MRAATSAVLFLTAVLAARGNPAFGDEQAGTGKRYALLVGIEQYDHAKLREPAPLQYSVRDAAETAEVLKDLGYEVTLLTDDTGRDDPNFRPSKANIERLLRDTLRNCGRGDTVLLGFAGHGLQFTGQKDAYFCPIDARPFADETNSLISIAQIYGELERSFAGVKIILVDACRNDPDPGRGRGLDADAVPAPPKGVAALFSCSAGQRAFEHDDLKHGIFFHHVLQGLRGEAKNQRGFVTFDGLAAYVRESVPETLATLLPDRQQLPNLKADLVGRPPVLADYSRSGGDVPPVEASPAPDPAPEQPAPEEQTTEEPTTEQPAAEEPATEEQPAEEQPVEEQTTEEPAADEMPADDSSSEDATDEEPAADQ